MIKYDKARLEKIIEDYANVAGVSISVWDSECNPLTDATYKTAVFCEHIKSFPGGKEKCLCSDFEMISRCRETKQFVAHVCHAGITDAVYPIIKNDIILGYIILGRMRTEQKFSDIAHRLNWISPLPDTLVREYADLEFYRSDRVRSIANLAAIITAYILTDNVINADFDHAIKDAVEYVDANLSGDLSIDTLCKQLNISKNLLYKNFHLVFNRTVNDYISERRIERARFLLKNTAKSVNEIAEETGIGDYTYFCKLFKKRTGLSPTQYRKSVQA